MAEFEIEYKKASRWAEEINSCSKELGKQEGRVSDVLGQIKPCEENYRGIEQALSGITDSLHRQQEQVRQYAGMLGRIVSAYESTEADILVQSGQEYVHKQ